jgi:hypothetical protein
MARGLAPAREPGGSRATQIPSRLQRRSRQMVRSKISSLLTVARTAHSASSNPEAGTGRPEIFQAARPQSITLAIHADAPGSKRTRYALQPFSRRASETSTGCAVEATESFAGVLPSDVSTRTGYFRTAMTVTRLSVNARRSRSIVVDRRSRGRRRQRDGGLMLTRCLIRESAATRNRCSRAKAAALSTPTCANSTRCYEHRGMPLCRTVNRLSHAFDAQTGKREFGPLL